MLKAKTPLLVGLLVILGAAAFIFAFGKLDRGMDIEAATTLYVRFTDATGLVRNSRVMQSGIAVGRLGEVVLDPANPALARVELFIKPEIKLREGIYDKERDYWVNGATATRQQASLIGDFYVALTPGFAGPVLTEGGYIRNAIADTGLGAVMKNVEESSSSIFPKLAKITDDISAVTGTLRKTLGEQGSVDSLMRIREDIEVTTRNVAGLTKEMRAFLNAEIYPRGGDIEAIAGNIEATTAAIRESSLVTLGRLDQILIRFEETSDDIQRFVADQTASPDEAKPGTVSATIAALDKNMAVLEGSLENIRQVTEDVSQGKGTVGRLLHDDKLINDVERVVENVQSFTESLSRTQIRVDFRADYFFQKDAFKSTLSVSFHPTPDKYYLLQLLDDPVGRVKTIRRVTASNDPRIPPILVEDISEQTSDFKFTIMVAKRWRFLTFRYGLMESSGGLGLDASLLEDSLRFQLDAFDFSAERFPRLRLLATWEFFSNIYISGGIDNMLNNSTRDWFVGLGVRFNEDDAVGTLMMAPTP